MTVEQPNDPTPEGGGEPADLASSPDTLAIDTRTGTPPTIPTADQRSLPARST